MKTSENGIKVLKYFEQCRLEAFPDPGSKDGHPWTIGWGHTGPEVVKGLVWTQEQCDKALIDDLLEREDCVTDNVRVPINQGQFDALVLFVYNVGKQPFIDSTLLKMLNKRHYDVAHQQFMRWVFNDGQKMHGLVRRRTAEACLFAGKPASEAIATAEKA